MRMIDRVPNYCWKTSLKWIFASFWTLNFLLPSFFLCLLIFSHCPHCSNCFSWMLRSHLLLPTCPLFLFIFLPTPLVSPPSSTASLCSSPARAPVLSFYLKKPTAFYNKATEFRSGCRAAHKEKSFLEQCVGHTVLIINKSWEMRSPKQTTRGKLCNRIIRPKLWGGRGRNCMLAACCTPSCCRVFG